METNELIKIQEKDGKRLVSARELYVGLKVQKDFAPWIKNQLEAVDAEENVDFTTVWHDSFKKVVNFNGNVNSMTRNGCSIDYALTTDIAKEVCMVVGASPRTNPETKALSKKFRRYFIECEKKLVQIKQDSYMIEDRLERAKRWIEEEEERRRLESRIEEQKPLVQLAEARIDKKGCFSITDVTKSLGLKRGQITRYAKDKGFLHKTQQEVNKAGEKYFKVYSSDGKHNQIGIIEDGLKYIKQNIEEIKEF